MMPTISVWPICSFQPKPEIPSFFCVFSRRARVSRINSTNFRHEMGILGVSVLSGESGPIFRPNTTGYSVAAAKPRLCITIQSAAHRSPPSLLELEAEHVYTSDLSTITLCLTSQDSKCSCRQVSEGYPWQILVCRASNRSNLGERGVIFVITTSVWLNRTAIGYRPCWAPSHPPRPAARLTSPGSLPLAPMSLGPITA
ncbi:hypothetical protein GQ607_015612 [Colletotrichum asianum]|uniref:Uncharacterized protein n=1 Tax=Colletotrichum asianum TaxID=702518 RepID=A0A8H3W0Q6_9PEZI|nr:hypothetical protein GQ607_015612 [Colletotrichum asianum]